MFGWVKFCIIMMLGNFVILWDIILMLVSVLGVCRFWGDLMNSIIGVIVFIGKWWFIVLYFLMFLMCCGIVLRLL